MSGLYKRALFLEYFTVGYNLVEAFASILFGKMAGSIALIGFGLDSIVESLSGMVMIWRLRKHGEISVEQEAKIEKRAQMFVAITFLILAAYVLYESIDKLLGQEIPEPSFAGIVIAIISIIVMPVLMVQKYRVGKQISSKALIADSKETLACAFLSVALLIGLGANFLFGFWMADPIVGLVIVVFLIREGIENMIEFQPQT
ncbi:cation transporter, partial [candidate division WOR-3 bacterium]|nr:cation transporter [candidate division WOR-3 bacterium]